MSRKCKKNVTTDDRGTFKKVLDADKDKVRCDQTLGNNNKDAMFDCRSGFYKSVEKHNCHINFCDHFHDYYIYHAFAQTD